MRAFAYAPTMSPRIASLLLLSLVLTSAACGLIAPAKSPEAELFDCRAAALESLTGNREAAVAAARGIYGEGASPGGLAKLVASAKPARAAVAKLLSDLEKCEHPDAGTGDAGSEVAP